jgi:cyclopropane-fatty-acyl-phospholipid synthase
MANRSKILALGFDEKFVRTWEYYFDYCAAGFQSRTLGDYQVVFSRPGNAAALGNPYQSFHQDLDSVPEGEINRSYYY